MTLLAATLGGCATVSGGSRATSPASVRGLVASVPVGRGPTLLAISPDGATVYAASVGKIFAIRTATNTVTASADVPPYTTGLVVTPDGASVLVTAMSSSSLGVLPAATLRGGTNISLPQDLHPGGYGRFAVAADGRTAWIVNEALWLALVDLQAGSGRRIQTDLRPRDVALGRDGRTLFVAGCKGFCATGTLEAVAAASGDVGKTYDVGPTPYRLALSPDGRRAYTTNLRGSSLSVVDLTGATPVATLSVGVEPTGLAVAPNGGRVYVVGRQTRTLTVARGDGKAVLVTASLPGMPRDVVLSPDGTRAYVSTSSPDAVLVLDTQRLAAGD